MIRKPVNRSTTLHVARWMTPLLIGACVGCQGIAPAGTWAIRCITRVGPEQYTEAKQFAESLRRVNGLNPRLVKTYTDSDGAHVYYGSYRRVYDEIRQREDFKPDPNEPMALIRRLSYDGGRTFPFSGAILEEIPTENVGPKDWDLANVDGFWTLQIAVFYNTAAMTRRRQAAVEYCRALRARGYEAYYYHSMSKSVVTLGAYPEWAVTFREETPVSLTGRPAEKRTVVEINDPGLLKLQREFPDNLENGARMLEKTLNPRTNKIEKIARPSFMAKMPKVTRREQELQTYESVFRQ